MDPKMRLKRRPVTFAASKRSEPTVSAYKKQKALVAQRYARALIVFVCILYTCMIVQITIVTMELQQQHRVLWSRPTKKAASIEGKERFLKILKDAGIEEIDNSKLELLPTWDTVVSLYGDGPRIYGLDQCQVYKEQIQDPAERFLGIAGNFNTGTNLLYYLLEGNCYIPEKLEKYAPKKHANGMMWQVPWGKHNPPTNETFRQVNKGMGMDRFEADSFLPAVTIRDPYFWMKSMCRHGYSTGWRHTGQHCPNLIPNQDDLKHFPKLPPNEPIPVHVRYFRTWIQDHDSLLHMWNDFYDFYYRNATFPRIMVRMEDLIFYPKETISTMCDCVGGVMNESQSFQHVANQAKYNHASTTGLLDAMIMYGNYTVRYDGLTSEDLEFARKAVNHELMNAFGYAESLPINSESNQ